MSLRDAVDPEHFAEVLARFDADMERAFGSRSGAILRWEEGEAGEGWEDPEDGCWVLEWPGSTRWYYQTFSIRWALSEIHDDVICDERVAWPECPAHGHPLEIVERDGDYWWECPADASSVVALGRVGLDP